MANQKSGFMKTKGKWHSEETLNVYRKERNKARKRARRARKRNAR